MSRYGQTGASADTAKNVLFGAGTIHKNLTCTEGVWNFEDSIIGATSGGSKISIIPEITRLAVDGVNVAAKGLTEKTGETAKMEVNFVELSKDLIMAAVLGQEGTSEDAAYDLIESKASIEVGDYLNNVAFVGKTMDGRNVICLMENALCTTGLELEGKAKEGAIGKYTFECHADLATGADTLPWKMYYPKAV